MKKKRLTKLILYIVICVLVAAGLLCGNISIRHMFLNYALQQDEIFVSQVASRDPQYLPQADGVNEFAVFNTNGAMFQNEQCLAIYHNADLTDLFIAHARDIQKGSTFTYIGEISGLSGKYILIGAPARDGDTVKSVVVYIQATEQLFSTMHMFDLVYGLITVSVILLLIITFQQYYKKSLALEKLQRDYIANVSHELKSPIASIKALSETMLDGVVTDEDKKRNYLSIIMREAGKLEYMVLNILQLSRLQSEREPVNKCRTTGDEIFHDLLQKYSSLCEESDISFHVQFSMEDVPELYTDAGKTAQILGIFLDNALKFVKDEGTITLTMNKRVKDVIFTVTDDGIGIRKEDIPYIFNRFYKGSKDYNAKGSGLGLAIAQELALLLEENISVESEYQKGSQFGITVARAQ